MKLESTFEYPKMSFRRAVWLFPATYTLHVLEELPRFTLWAQKYASPSYDHRDYLRIHIAGVVSAFLAAALLSYFSNRVLLFLFFTLMLTPSLFYNALFHTGATFFFRSYCPGTVTALLLYLPVYWLVIKAADNEKLIGRKSAMVSFVFAGLFHFAEVGHNVFKAW